MDLSICREIKFFSQDPWLYLMVLTPFGNGDLVYFLRKFLLAASFPVQVCGEKRCSALTGEATGLGEVRQQGTCERGHIIEHTR